jgi:anti-sigma factor RsiW
MDCNELVELVTDYLEGRLPDAERERFEGHLEECAGCGNYLEQMRSTISVTGTLREDDLPPGAAESLLAEFRDWKRSRA